MDRISLASAFNPVDPNDLQDADQRQRQNEQTIEKGRIALKEVQRLSEQDQAVRATVKQHTVKDPATGQTATDNAAVIRDLYIKDPEAAERYQTHVETMSAERTQRKASEQKAVTDQQKAQVALVGEALAAIDEKGDQEQAKADYAAAIADLKQKGVPLQPGDEIYSPSRVAYWKRRVIGADDVYKADNAAEQNKVKIEAAAKLAEQKANDAAELAKQKGESAERVASIRAAGTQTAAAIRAGATVQAASIRAASSAAKDDISDDDEEDDVVELLADTYLLNGTLPALGQGQGALRKAALKRAAAKAKASGTTVGDIASRGAAQKANTSSLSKNQTNADAVKQAEETAIANGQIFLDISKRIAPKRGNYSFVNAVKNTIGRHSGDPDIVAMDGALKTFTSEYARVVSSSPSGAGQLTDSARKEAMDTISGNYSMAQKQAALDTLKKDMRNRVRATNNQLNTIRERTKTGGSSVDLPRKAPPGVVRLVRMNGVLYNQMSDGKLVKANK